MLDIINKAAITVIPKEPFIKWVQSTDAKAAEISDEDILSNSQVYLVDTSGSVMILSSSSRGISRSSSKNNLRGGTRMKKHGPQKWICGYLSSGSM